jgi:hypothetical protein
MHIEPPTPRAARVLRAPRAATVAVTALACAALMSACGSSTSSAKTNLNTARVAKSIEETVLAKRHLKSSVVCPAAVPQEAGRTFECIATSTSPKPPHAVTKTPFVVTIQNSGGYVTYVGR